MTPEYLANFRLPNRHYCLQVDEGAWWDVKFYPYLTAADDPAVFAVVSSWGFNVFLAKAGSACPVEQLFAYRFDEEMRPKDSSSQAESVELNACTWCHVQPRQPLLAVAGQNGLICLYDPFTGKIASSLVGHGTGTINDLATHPKYPWIIASAALDGSIRIWDVRRMHEKTESATVVICGHNMAHKDGLLSVGWHESGRYIVSSGFDHNICVWVVPDFDASSDFWRKISKAQRKRSADAVQVIHYPHFISSALHNDYVDKVMFVQDFILSKSACSDSKRLNTIAMWSITGFDSTLEPPNELAAPKAQEWLDTRNGFMRSKLTSIDDDTAQCVSPEYRHQPPYTRHFEFQIRHTSGFYMRFGMSRPSVMFPDVHHVLCMGNSKSDIFFWDLDRFVHGHDGVNGNKRGLSKHIAQLAILKNTMDHILSPESTGSSRPSSARETSDTSMQGSSTTGTSLTLADDVVSVQSTGPDRRTYPLDDPYKPLLPHCSLKVKPHDTADKNAHFMSLGTDWSSCGRWCVVSGFLGTRGSLAICYRQP